MRLSFLDRFCFQERGRRRKVGGISDQVVVCQDPACCRRRVDALVEDEPVQVGGAEVGGLVPVRVAHELDAPPGLVTGDLALRVVLDHVWAGRDEVLAVGGALALVVLGCVPPSAPARMPAARAPARRRPRFRGKASSRRWTCLGSSMPVISLASPFCVGLAADHVGPVKARIAVRDLWEEAALERVLDVWPRSPRGSRAD